MLNADRHTTIPGNVSTKDDLDFSFLKQLGIEYIEKYGSKIWTDYNTHDPGITILEALCYAITDLGYRISMPIEDILSAPGSSNDSLAGQFIKAEQILPAKPVTGNDYRKLFIDIDGIKNAWLRPFKKKVFVNCKDKTLSYSPFETEDKYKKEFTLQGLYEILLDFDDFDPGTYNTDALIANRKKQLENEVRTKYHQNRNLCEDLMTVAEVGFHPVSVCAIIDVKPEADEEMVHARVLRAINTYFSPSVRFYSLQEMFAKGYSSTEIFDGPVLNNGFIDPAELEKAGLRKEIRLSDIVRLIMDIDGVRVIKDISINNCGTDSKPEGQPWVICIGEGLKPRLCEKSVFSYTKGVLPVNINHERVKEYSRQLEAEETETQKLAQISRIIELPTGNFLNIGEYSAIQNNFPETYGIGEFGLSASATGKRKAQAKQLQAYLLFFDQILASYFCQLDKVKELLSVNPSAGRSYFSQAIKDIKGIENLVSPEYLNGTAEELSESLFSMLDKKNDRKNQLLDHLLARFAENFGTYAFLMKQLYGNDHDLAIIRSKENFLRSYPVLGTERGAAFNCYHPKGSLWNTTNVSTVEKRIALLTGQTDFSRRNLSNDPVEIYQEKDNDGLIEYRWRIKDPAQQVLCSGSKKYFSKEEMDKEILLVKALATNMDNYEIKKAKSGKFYYNLTNPEITDTRDEGHVVARRLDYYQTKEAARDAVRQFVSFMKKVKPNEGMYLIEHILIRPDELKTDTTINGTFLPVCSCDDSEPADPYSFRVSVVLPGWTERFSNMDFRNFMENLIRKELPAHALARICWIGYPDGKVDDDKNEMIQLEQSWKAFLETLNQTDPNTQTIVRLNTALSQLHSIYPTGFLYDCENETENLKGKIILGRTNLGNI